MSFAQLFTLYCTFISGESLHHESLVQPIREYARSVNTAASTIVQNLRDMYLSA